MNLDQIIEQSDALLSGGFENSPTDALRLVNYLAKWVKAQENIRAFGWSEGLGASSICATWGDA